MTKRRGPRQEPPQLETWKQIRSLGGEGVFLLEMVMDVDVERMLGWLVFFFNVWTLEVGYGSFRKFGVASIVDRYCPIICRATI